MRHLALILILSQILIASGCDKLPIPDKLNKLMPGKSKHVEQAKVEPLMEKVESPQLAQMILKPEKHRMVIKRDPFQPLSMLTPVIAQTPGPEAQEEDILANLEYLGVVIINNEFSALLKMGEKKGIYHVKDKINTMTILDIKNEYVMLKSGSQTFTLKRGVK